MPVQVGLLNMLPGSLQVPIVWKPINEKAASQVMMWPAPSVET